MTPKRFAHFLVTAGFALIVACGETSSPVEVPSHRPVGGGLSLSAYVFPSTNDDNRTAGLPHVNQIAVGIGQVTLEFVNDENALAFFEYRIDGQILTSGTAHPVVTGDFIYDGVCVDNRAGTTSCGGQTSSKTEVFTATQKVEVRLALGGERDWDFDWVTFEVIPDVQSAEDCRNGGWEAFGFANQGRCIQFVNTGQDTRS